MIAIGFLPAFTVTYNNKEIYEMKVVLRMWNVMKRTAQAVLTERLSLQPKFLEKESKKIKLETKSQAMNYLLDIYSRTP